MQITDVYEIQLIKDYRDGYRGIYWHVDDFELKACELEEWKCAMNPELTRPLYDRSQFEDALNAMIDRHDANIGISWDTVAIYLNEYCLIQNKDE